MCVSVCLSVTTLAATYLVYMSKVRWCTVFRRLLKICYCVETICSGDMALYACHDDQRLATKNTPLDLDMITNGIVYELLDRSDGHLN